MMDFTSTNNIQRDNLGLMHSTSGELKSSPEKLQRAFKSIERGSLQEFKELIEGTAEKTMVKLIGKIFCLYNQNPEVYRMMLATILKYF
jgi:hypothetical protein